MRSFRSCLGSVMLAAVIGCGGGGPKVYVYDDYTLIGNHEVYMIQSGEIAGGAKIADLWIKIGDSNPLHLPQLTPEDLRKLKTSGHLEWFKETQDVDGTVEFATSENDFFGFTNDRIASLKVKSEDEIAFSGAKQGPFKSFPMSLSDARAIFGKPLRSFTSKPSSAP